MTDNENSPETTSPTSGVHPTGETTNEITLTSAPLAAHLLEQRPEVRKRLLVWSGIFVTVFALFLLVSNIEELREFDPVFLPSLFLLVIVTLIYGYVVGTARGLRYCLKWSKKNLDSDATD